MSESDDNSRLLRSRVMNDDELYYILSYFTLKEKLKLSCVSKQFYYCVDRELRSQKCLKIKATNNFRSHFSDGCHIVIENLMEYGADSEELAINTIKEKFGPTFRKLSNLKRLIIQFGTINKQFCEWIRYIFSSVKSVEIHILKSSGWNLNKFLILKQYFGTKATHLTYYHFNYDLMISSELFLMNSLKAINLIESITKEKSIQILTNLKRNVKSFGFSSDLDPNNLVINALISGNAKNLEELRLECHYYHMFNGNEILSSICLNLTQLKKLEFICGSLVSLEIISSLKSLEKLKIQLKTESLIIVSIEDYEILAKLKNLDLSGNYKLLPNTMKYMKSSFPNIKRIRLDAMKIDCVCSHINEVCFDCYNEFIRNTTNAYENCVQSNSPFNIVIFYANCKPYNYLLISSIFDEYLVSQHSYRLVINTNNSEKVRNNFFEIGIMLAYKRPNVVIIFKVDINLSKESHSYKALMPSNVKLVIVNKDYKYGNESIDSKNLVVYMKPLFAENNRKKGVTVLFGKRNHSIHRIYIDLLL